VQITVTGEPQRVMRRCVEESPAFTPFREDDAHCAACHYGEESAQRHSAI